MSWHIQATPVDIRSIPSSSLGASAQLYQKRAKMKAYYTKGRFVSNEAQEMSQRHVRYDVQALEKIGAVAVRARSCVKVKKLPDGNFNKALLLTMNDGREVVAKVPNPNVGLPHLTIASEVATMDFVSLDVDLNISMHWHGRRSEMSWQLRYQKCWLGARTSPKILLGGSTSSWKRFEVCHLPMWRMRWT